LCLAVVRIGAFPVITNVVETGGDGAPFAQFTGQTFTGPTIGTYTVPLFGVLAKSMADRLHAYTNASGTVAMPPYLVGQEYIMIRNDNRDNANLQLVVGVATAVRAYLLIDNRVNDSANGNPPTLTGSIIWVVNDGWTPVTTGLNRAGSLAVPDEVGIDESADGSINQWFSIYSKDFPAGTFVTGPQNAGGINIYGIVVASVAPPPTPTGLAAVALDGQVRLTWFASPSATSYSVLRSETSGGPYSVAGSPTTTNFTDTAVLNGTTYFYVVVANGQAGSSARSAEVSATPRQAPSNLVAVGGTNQVTLTWTGLGNAESYTIKRALGSGGPYTDVASGLTTTDYLDTAVQPGTRYYYVVQAVLTGGILSGLSLEADAPTAPSAPAVTAFVYASTMLELSWTNTNPVVTGFSLERSPEGGPFAVVATLPGTQRAYQDTGLDASTTYAYRLQATNSTGFSDYSGVVTVSTPAVSYNVNFANAINGQPANDPAPTPAGYVQDVGLVFADQGNGYSYGWNRDITPDGRWRKSANAPDLRYDTFNHLMKALPSAIWEIDIPNGFYAVRIVAGDASNVDSTFQFMVEGLTTPTYIPSSGAWWGEFRTEVGVSDNRLTLTSGPSASNNKIAFIDILPAVPTAVALGTQPQSQVVVENRPVTLSVTTTAGSFPIFYQWYHNEQPVEGGNSSSLAFPLAQLDDAGSYYVIITNYAGAVTTEVATLTVDRDDTPPTLLSAGSLNGRQVCLVFDEGLDPVSAQENVNYSINGGLVVGVQTGGAILRPDGRSVLLLLDGPVTGPLTVEGFGIRDLTARDANTLDFSTTIDPIWQNSLHQDIGTNLGDPVLADPKYPGSIFVPDSTTNVLEVYAGGSDLWNTNDGGHFVYEIRTGDFDAKVRVESLTQVDVWTKAGLMARASLNANSANVALLVPPAAGSNAYTFQVRAADGIGTVSYRPAPVRPAYPEAWVRLRRSGGLFEGLVSSNGVDWTVYASTNLGSAFPATVYLGLATTAHNNSGTNFTRAVYANYTVTQPTADLAVAKTASANPVLRNSNFTYTLVVTNQGPDAAAGVTLVDTLPAGITYLVGAATQGSCSHAAGVVTCNLGTINPAASVTVVLTVRASTTGLKTNSAAVSASAADPVPENNTATFITTVYVQPSIPPGSLTYSSTGGTGGGPSFSGAISTAAGLTYIVEYKDNLTDENWSPLTLIEGDGTVKPFTDAGPLPPNRFYRTRIYVP
jgi:uncharacterized repeat protein (TIGR01451 family)